MNINRYLTTTMVFVAPYLITGLVCSDDSSSLLGGGGGGGGDSYGGGGSEIFSGGSAQRDTPSGTAASSTHETKSDDVDVLIPVLLDAIALIDQSGLPPSDALPQYLDPILAQSLLTILNPLSEAFYQAALLETLNLSVTEPPDELTDLRSPSAFTPAEQTFIQESLLRTLYNAVWDDGLDTVPSTGITDPSEWALANKEYSLNHLRRFLAAVKDTMYRLNPQLATSSSLPEPSKFKLTNRAVESQQAAVEGVVADFRRLQAQPGPLGALMGRLAGGGGGGGSAGLSNLVQSFVVKELDGSGRKNSPFRMDPRCDAHEKGTCCFFGDLCDPIANCVAETNPQSLGDLARLVPQCICPEGFKGDGRKRGDGCVNIDECKEGIAYCDQKCIDMAPGYRCECRDGYRLQPDARSCRDIDECKEGLHDCDDVCINTKGGFECGCSSGFKPDSLNPHKCNDIDECLEATIYNRELCQFMDMCTNLPGSYSCWCPQGTAPDPNDPSLCIDIDECTELDDDPCPNSRGSGYDLSTPTQWCENVYGGFNCMCLPGLKEAKTSAAEPLRDLKRREIMAHDGKEIELRYQQSIIRAQELLCADIDECQEDPNMCPGDNVVCVNEYRSAFCRCLEPGMQWNASTKRCYKDITCRADTCGTDPNSMCIQYADDFECTCREGYQVASSSGAHKDFSCEDINECATSDDICPPNSTCQNLLGTYKCVCDHGFLQIAPDGQCVDIDECAAGACAGPCLNLDGAYTCGCPHGTMAKGRHDPTQSRMWSLLNDRINSASNHDVRIAAFHAETRESKLTCERYDVCAESEGLLCGAGAQCRGTEGTFSCFCPIGTEMRATKVKDFPLLEDAFTRQIALHIRTLPFDAISDLDPLTLLTAVASLEPPTPLWKINSIPWQASSRFHIHRTEKQTTALLDDLPSRETMLALLLELISEAEVTSCEPRDLPRNVFPTRFTFLTTPPPPQLKKSQFPPRTVAPLLPAPQSPGADFEVLKKRRPSSSGLVGGLLSQFSRFTKPQSPVRRTSSTPSSAATRDVRELEAFRGEEARPFAEAEEQPVTLVAGPGQFGLEGVNGLPARTPRYLYADMGVPLNVSEVKLSDRKRSRQLQEFLQRRLTRAEASLNVVEVHRHLNKLSSTSETLSTNVLREIGEDFDPYSVLERVVGANATASVKPLVEELVDLWTESSGDSAEFIRRASRIIADDRCEPPQCKWSSLYNDMKSVVMTTEAYDNQMLKRHIETALPIKLSGALVATNDTRGVEALLLTTILAHLSRAVPDLNLLTNRLMELSRQLQIEEQEKGLAVELVGPNSSVSRDKEGDEPHSVAHVMTSLLKEEQVGRELPVLRLATEGEGGAERLRTAVTALLESGGGDKAIPRTVEIIMKSPQGVGPLKQKMREAVHSSAAEGFGDKDESPKSVLSSDDVMKSVMRGLRRKGDDSKDPLNSITELADDTGRLMRRMSSFTSLISFVPSHIFRQAGPIRSLMSTIMSAVRTLPPLTGDDPSSDNQTIPITNGPIRQVMQSFMMGGAQRVGSSNTSAAVSDRLVDDQ